MTAETALDRPVILPALSSKTQTCTSCSASIAVGDPIAFDCTTGPQVLCGPCGETAGGQPVRTVRLGGDGDGRARLGDVGTITKVTAPALPATVELPDVEGQADDEQPAAERPLYGPVAPRFDHDEPIGPAACRCGQPDVDGSHQVDEPCAITSTVDDEPAPLTDLTPWTDQAIGYGTDPKVVAAEFVEAVRLGILAGDIRGRQREIGPSEVGHPCARALAYRLAGTPHTGTEPTPWRQRIGTLVHADNDDHLAADNERRGTRWLTNVRVRVGELYPGRPIDGTLDVFDVQTGTLLDEKVPGATAMKNYAPGKPESDQYRKQVQLYGAGAENAGFTPAWVGVLRLSPARELSEYVWKFEPYDRSIATEALSRAGGIARMVDQLDQRAPALLPGTEHVCHRCPWLRRGSTDLTTGCPGVDTPPPSRRASVDDLVG